MAVLQIFEEVSSEFPGAAEVTHEPGEGGLTLVHLAPARNSAAPISAAVEPDGSRVYLSIGRTTPLEIDGEGGSFTDLSSLDEIREIIRQVVQGNFEETVWSKGDTIVKAIGILTLKGQRVRIRFESLEGGPLTWIRQAFTATRKEQHRYTSYA